MSVMRKVYRELSAEEKALVELIKDKAEELHGILGGAPPSREIALAKTNLEQAVMWAVKAIT
jgi:hypothetical protein